MKPQIEGSLPPEIQNSSRRSEILADMQMFETQLFAIVKDRLDFAKIKPDFIKLYDETYTSDELTGIVALYKSPGGQAYLTKLPVLMSKSVDLSMKTMAGSMQEIQQMTASWTEDMQKKYGNTEGK